MLAAESIFDLPVTFVVAFEGAAGNFIAKILSRLRADDDSDLSFSNNGNSHRRAGEFIPFQADIGLEFLWRQRDPSIPKFDTFEQKVAYFKNRVIEFYANNTQPYIKIHAWVTRSHNFGNIPLYRALFPNCKIILVTQYSLNEYWTGQLNYQLKSVLETNPQDIKGMRPANFIITHPNKAMHHDHWISYVTSRLMSMMPVPNLELATTLINDKFNPEYKDILCYASLVPQHELILDDTLINAKFNNINDIIKKNEFDCIILPYASITQNDTETFVHAINSVHLGALTEKQKMFIVDNLNRYFQRHHPLIMSDPVEYYKQMESRAYAQIATLQNA